MHRLTFSELGFTERMRAAVHAALTRRPTGLLLISSPRGQGRTSTLHAVIFDFNPYPRPGPKRRGEARPPASRISIVEDIDDARTAEVARERLAKGETIFATTAASSGADALASLLRFGFTPEELARDLRGCIHQRLAPRACPACALPIWSRTSVAAAFAGTLAELAPEGRRDEEAEFCFLSSRECPECAGPGGKGEIGVFEWIDPLGLSFEAGAPVIAAGAAQAESIGMRDDLLEKLISQALTIDAAADLLWRLEN